MMYFNEKRMDNILQSAEVVIFDMNGLIIDDEPVHMQAVNHVLSDFNIRIDDSFWINECVGYKPQDVFTKAFACNGLNKEISELKEIVKKKDVVYENLITNNLSDKVREGALDIIDYVSINEKKQIALATSNTRKAMEIIIGTDGLNLFDKFDFIICGDQVIESKPNPEIFLKVRDFFKNANNFLVFEDSVPGVISAKRAEAICIAVPSICTNGQDFSEADIVASSLRPDARVIN